MQIDALPDDILLEIFDFYANTYPPFASKPETEAWQSLVHVCQRWRSLVLGSPRGLNLQLHCTPETPVKDTLDVWQALPLIIRGDMTLSTDVDNVAAALEQSNRVREISLNRLASWQLEEVLDAMQVPFPELTELRLTTVDETPPLIPDSFLDGSAPRLRHLELFGIPFPGLPKLHLFADHLVFLGLYNTPHSGYISPKAIVALISVLTSVKSICLGFQSPRSRPDRKSRSPPSPKRSVLPALDFFLFQGVIDYLEDLLTLIDAPRLIALNIYLFNQIDFDCPRLAQFINSTPTINEGDEAHVQFEDIIASVKLRHRTSKPGFNNLRIEIPCRGPGLQLSSIRRACNSSLHPISAVEDLYIEHKYSELVWKNDAVENTLWLQLLALFTPVKNLYLSKEFAPGIAAALQELVGSRITDVLPSLQNIFVEEFEPSGPFQENIGQFVAARLFCDHPVAIFDWDEDSNTKQT